MLNKWEKHICKGRAKAASLGKKTVENFYEEMNFHKEEGTYPYNVLRCPIKKRTPSYRNNYSFDNFERWMFTFIGPERTKASRAANKVNMRQVDSNKEKFIEINGIAGEFLYGRIYNLYPYECLEINARSAEEDAGDFNHQKEVVDVKTTEYHTGKLILANWKSTSKVTWLCLMIGNYCDYSRPFRMCGFQRIGYVATNENYRLLPNTYENPLYWVHQDELIASPDFLSDCPLDQSVLC